MAEGTSRELTNGLESFLISHYDENVERFGDMWVHVAPTDEVHCEVLQHFEGVSKKKVTQCVKKLFKSCKIMKYRGINHYFGLQKKAIEGKMEAFKRVLEDDNQEAVCSHSQSPDIGRTLSTGTQTHKNEITCYTSVAIQTVPEENIPQEFFKQLPKQFIINPSLLDSTNEVVLGEGTFSTVKMMNFKGIQVAVKEYKESSHYSSSSMKKRILNEATSLLNIAAHEGIPFLLGVSMETKRWLPVLIDYSESCRIEAATPRPYRNHHDYLDQSVLAGDAPSVESDVFSFCMLIKKVVQYTNIDDQTKKFLLGIARQGTESANRPNSKELSEMLLAVKF
eukprot:gene5819-6515_t